MGKIYTELSIFSIYVFQRCRKIVFHHTNHHYRISGTLALNMIDFAPNKKMGVCNNLSALRLMLISLLYNGDILRISRSKNLIDQWNNKPRYLPYLRDFL